MRNEKKYATGAYKTLVKLLLNSLYGYFGQTVTVSKTILCNTITSNMLILYTEVLSVRSK